MSFEGIKTFFANHECSIYCEKMKLTPEIRPNLMKLLKEAATVYIRPHNEQTYSCVPISMGNKK